MKRALLSAALFGCAVFATQCAIAADTAAEPHAAAGQFADIKGAKLHYSVTGRGQPMILIHGYPLNSGLFKDQVEALSRNYRLVLLDLPGFGQSETDDDDSSLQEYAETVLGLMDELKIDKAIIGGHSMGGMTAIEMYRIAPERFSGMILIDATAKPAPPADQEWLKGLADQAEKKGKNSVAQVLVPQMLTGDARSNNPELMEYAQSLVTAASIRGLEGGGEALAERPDNSKVLSQIKVPVLIIVGIEDALTPVVIAKEMNRAIRGSKLVVIEGASHASVLEKPKQANDAILGWARQIKPAAGVAGRAGPKK